MGQMKWKVALSVMMVGVLSIVSACSPSNESSTSNVAATEKGQSSGSDGQKPKKMTAVVDNNFLPYMQKIGAEFEKQYGIKVETITTDYNSLHNKLVTSLASGDSSLDIFETDTVWPKEFVSAGFLEPLDSYLPSGYRDNLTSTFKQFLVDDKLYAFPADNEMKFLYYNEKMLKDGGFNAPPKTWDELIQMSKDLKAKGIAKTGVAFAWKQAEGLLCEYALYLNAFGGKFQDANGNWVFNEGGGLKALEFMVSMLKDKDIADPASTTLDDGTVLNTFTGGQIPFMLNWSFAVSALKDNKDIKLALIPGVKGGSESTSVTGGAGIGVSKFSKNKEWAGKLIQLMSDRRNDIIVSNLVGGLPPYKDMATNAELKAKFPDLDVMNKQLDFALIRPQVAGYTDWSQNVQVAISKALMGEKSPKDALDEAKKKIVDSKIK
ncbi:extracellular solute-binding protein [Paenibacillus frigoriresistens]|uniref:extracellular solute-binding protein n=1 Tax=Paenibacillus alginolyticus TaxID=59839 RepID=UPI00156314B0|nr:extracellular solute-binding protein [Paenibacillus frigoriresistens]NRF90384.1 extracellular solute-binding protein [Paenibacillus frigoriresistens]